MTYALRLWGAGGPLQMDTDSFTYQVIHNALYNLNGNPVITVNIPGFSVSNCVATILPTEASTGDYANNAMPYMSVAPGVVTVRSKNPGEAGNFGSLIRFRLLVMRFKN